ncbi:MAG: Ribosomal small subunit methyltransferase [Candidatus Kaiserbacteria bacterium]|nr:Ribosomal small subunit methyltransferase [Candidatus Kaiserbacteria bacterium]
MPSEGLPQQTGSPAQGHRTVLLHESVDSLDIQPTDIVVDATLGGAGHSKLIMTRLGKEGTLIGFDADSDAIERGKSALLDTPASVRFANANFRQIKGELEHLGLGRINKALFDLGWSSFQLSAGRGFSFLSDEPLSMAYANSPAGESALTAETIVNEWSEESIADVIFGWGEERYSRRIAKRIVEERSVRPIKTARELGDLVKAAVPSAYRYGRIHPATKTFQALRIAVNDELGALTEALKATWQILEPGGRIAVISFHSIEDRLVKQQFAAWVADGSGEKITKKPITPSTEEVASNPRSRSAKLRVIQKITI